MESRNICIVVDVASIIMTFLLLKMILLLALTSRKFRNCWQQNGSGMFRRERRSYLSFPSKMNVDARRRQGAQYARMSMLELTHVGGS